MIVMKAMARCIDAFECVWKTFSSELSGEA